jgi:hypothetical protein
MGARARACGRGCRRTVAGDVRERRASAATLSRRLREDPNKLAENAKENALTPCSRSQTSEQNTQAIKDAYDTLTDDRRRAAYEAATSYQRRTGGGGGANRDSSGSAGVNTDWTQRAASDREGASRLSRWQWWQRWARQEARAFDRTLHGGLAILTLGGLLLFDVGGDLVWSARNRGRTLEAVLAEKEEKERQQRQQQQQQQKQQRDEEGNDSAPVRRPGAWLESMRGRPVAASEAGDDGARDERRRNAGGGD